MELGQDVAKTLRKSRSGGIPWMVILDGNGKELISSDGAKRQLWLSSAASRGRPFPEDASIDVDEDDQRAVDQTQERPRCLSGKKREVTEVALGDRV